MASRCTATRLRDASENGPWDGRSCLDLGENRVPSIPGTIAFPWNNRAKNGSSRNDRQVVVARLKREERFWGNTVDEVFKKPLRVESGDDGE